MGTQIKNQIKSGKGYLVGALVGITAGILMFIFTKAFVLAIAIMLPLTISVGIGLEEKYNTENKAKNVSFRKSLWSLLIAGVLVFVSFLLYFILHS